MQFDTAGQNNDNTITFMATFKNNGKLKLLIIVGTRPEIIRLAAVINKCRKQVPHVL